MSTVLEYPTYDNADECLDNKDALELYRTEKARNPAALVTLNELHCGEHWRVAVYATKAEKEKYFRKRIQKLLERFEQLVQDIDKSHESTTSPR